MSWRLMLLPIPSNMMRYYMVLTNCRSSMYLPTSLSCMYVFPIEIKPKIILGISLLPLVPFFVACI